MKLNTNLLPYSTVRNIKYLSKAADVLIPQLERLGFDEIEVTVDSLQPERSAIRRFLKGIDIKNVDKTMTIICSDEYCDIAVEVSMINTGWLLPLEIRLISEGNIPFYIDCSRALFGRKWSCDPDNDSMMKKIKKVAPKVRKDHVWLALVVKLKTFYQIGMIDDECFAVIIYTGLKNGMFNKPKVDIAPYVNAAREMVPILLDGN